MDLRLAKLNKLFESIIRGTQQLTPNNGSLFLEAICAQTDAVVAISKITTSSEGKSALQAAMRFTLSPDFFNGQAAALLQYLQAPGLADINGGEFLNDILLKIVDPPIFWVAFRKAFIDDKLDDAAQKSLLWLLVQLVSIPGERSALYREPSQISIILPSLRSSSKIEFRTAGYKIQHILDTFAQPDLGTPTVGAPPGGRHDNDFSDFRKISILPTPDEIQSTEKAFLRTSDALEDPDTESIRVSLHLDNQFRLLREDMLYELRDEIQIVQGKKKGNHRGIKLNGLTLVGIQYGPEGKRTKWGLSLQCQEDLPELKGQKDRKKYLFEQRNFFRHQSQACLIVGEEIVAFPTIDRNEDLLAENPPIIVVQLEGRESTELALRKLKTENDVALIQINTAIFSYEPVLKALQQAHTIPLSDELLLWKEGNVMSQTPCQSGPVVKALQLNPQVNLQTLLDTNSAITLDSTQAASLCSGLTQKVALVQGPPGTGKSFLGALLAKSIYKFTEQTILVVCYTNHALDDILTGLLDIGIPETCMVRLGGKSTPRTDPLTLQTLKQAPGPRRDRMDWLVIDELKVMSEKLCGQLQRAFERYESANISYQDLLDYLEFEEASFYEAFRVPRSDDGLTHVGKKGRAVNSNYLIGQWCMGWDAGTFKSYPNVEAARDIWHLSRQARQELITSWKEKIFGESITEICVIAQEYNSCQERLARAFSDKVVNILRTKRIIGCTTTAAAKYTEDIQAASPDILLVEEAGEILESHVLAALGKKTSQLILIGDHKQLRPKVNNYALTVEKGDSFDLNRSLFERLVLKGYPHQSLTEQHRMRPEISSLIRHLTYPELVDAAKTKGRPHLDGVQDNIVFIDHDHPEDENHRISDRRDMASSSSKQNSHEAAMVLKIVRYLAQQGYGTDKIVILTPYLGQLQKLREALKKDNDPILNDLDSYDLVRAGLVPAASAKLAKKPIRLATIDNYQGEESEIVIVSLTRSNTNHDIGFMFSPERLNVLLSRARNALIMIGNSRTFKQSRKGGELWGKLFELLGHGKHMYSGLPVVCQRHPDQNSHLSQPTDFDEVCPDGGCNAPCDTMLSCGSHLCPSKCHQLYDHSKMLCQKDMSGTCDKGHKQLFKCHQGLPKSCKKCNQIEKADNKRQQLEYEAQQRMDLELQQHLRELAEIDAEIAREIETKQAARLAKERADVLKQRQIDLVSIRQQTQIPPDTRVSDSSFPAPNLPTPPNSPPNSDFLNTVISTAKALVYGKSDSSQALPSPDQPAQVPSPPFQLPNSPSQTEWQRQKSMEGANNKAIDSIMEMVGLEDVKKQVLEIKAKVDMSIRQGASITSERFNIVFLGNPGTGKTTIAKLYAKFLVTVKALPGPSFIETTGSRLANEGVAGFKKQIEDLLKAGGGAIFVDEAYQLASKHNHGGPVMDFLLTEMENNIGSIVFILAGYNKEMETFFEHNPGLKSRVPYSLHFADYEDHELMTILESLIFKTYQGRMKVQDGIRGLYGRIAIRRLGRRRGRNGFGNARDLQTVFAAIRGRQASRIHKERAEGRTPDDFLMLAEDFIGPDPSKAIVQSKAWSKLQSLIGIKAVKESITSLLHAIEENFQRELLEKEPLAFSLNRVFLGSPGTGKTTVAKLYGKVLADLGLLSNGEVVLKTPADFIGAVLGESEEKTKKILANSIGKVLIIDEAYMLYGGGGASTGNQSNQYKTTVIDTIVAEVQSVPGDDQCVLLLGYKDQMVEMFQNVNEGLSRRFRIEDPFNFEDFSASELMDILNMKLKYQDLGATDAAKKVVIEQLNRSRNRPNFGNAGEVENMIGAAKTRCVARRAEIPPSQRPKHIIFEPQDFCPDFDRSANASINLAKLFEDIVGCQDIISRLGEYQQIAVVSKERGLDPREQIPTNFVFIGPPGTGKTTIARKMGQVYYDMGILASPEVIECSASDLVGEYVGHTGPKTKKLFEKALGKVLFVDEAYRLGEGRFAQEAIDELVGLLTHKSFKSKVIVILAGYEGDMKRLMSVNTGLTSRFPDWIPFSNMDPNHCLDVVLKELHRRKVRVDELLDQSSATHQEMLAIIKDLSQLPDWGNARDMMTLAKDLISQAFLTDDGKEDSLKLGGSQVVACTKKMLADKQARSNIHPKSRHTSPALPEQDLTPSARPPPPIRTAQNAKKPPPPVPPRPQPSSSRQGARPAALPPKPSNPHRDVQPEQISKRDAGVSDVIWRELQNARRLVEAQDKNMQETIRNLQREVQREANREREHKRLAEQLAKAEAEAKDAAQRQAAKRKREQARLKEQALREAREKAAADLKAKQQEQQRRQAQEAKAQKKLREMGVCSAGYRWCRMGSGYRCAGGSHFISIGELGLD